MAKYGNYDYQKKIRPVRDSCRDRIFLPWYYDSISDVLYYDESHRISREMAENPDTTAYALTTGPERPEHSYDSGIAWWRFDRYDTWHYSCLYRKAECLGVRPFIWVEL